MVDDSLSEKRLEGHEIVAKLEDKPDDAVLGEGLEWKYKEDQELWQAVVFGRLFPSFPMYVGYRRTRLLLSHSNLEIPPNSMTSKAQ